MSNSNRFFKDIEDTLDVVFNGSMINPDAFRDFLLKGTNEVMNINKYEVLTKKYLNVIKISKGTIYENCPWKLVKLRHIETKRITSLRWHLNLHDVFINDFEIYFAISVLRNKPVFIGDYFYKKYSDELCRVLDEHTIQYPLGKMTIEYFEQNKSDFVWEEDDTFSLNGKIVPCPLRIQAMTKEVDQNNKLELLGHTIYFKTDDDAMKFKTELFASKVI